MAGRTRLGWGSPHQQQNLSLDRKTVQQAGHSGAPPPFDSASEASAGASSTGPLLMVIWGAGCSRREAGRSSASAAVDLAADEAGAAVELAAGEAAPAMPAADEADEAEVAAAELLAGELVEAFTVGPLSPAGELLSGLAETAA